MTDDDPPFIRVWPYLNAPVPFRSLVGHGFDWIALVPANFDAFPLRWLKTHRSTQVLLPDGTVVAAWST